MLELAEDELSNFAKVWALVVVAMSFCFIIGKITSKGFVRLIALLPVIFLFLALPMKLTSVHLCGFTVFFITWLGNFKLLLFAFGKPPLATDPPITYPRFLAIACLPINTQPSVSLKSEFKTNSNNHKSRPPAKHSNNPKTKSKKNLQLPNKSKPSIKKSPWNYIFKVTLLAITLKSYDHNDHIPQNVLRMVQVFHIYLLLELLLASLSKAVTSILRIELEPQFNEPLLSTSLQDFWGRRWNLTVTSILKPTVYKPSATLFSHVLGRKWAPLPAVMTTFLISGLMHELIFFYAGRQRPTLEVTWYFIMHGSCLCLEVLVKVYLGRRWRLPRWISQVATMAFMGLTGFYLFLPQVLRVGILTKAMQEYAILGAWARDICDPSLWLSSEA